MRPQRGSPCSPTPFSHCQHQTSRCPSPSQRIMGRPWGSPTADHQSGIGVSALRASRAAPRAQRGCEPRTATRTVPRRARKPRRFPSPWLPADTQRSDSVPRACARMAKNRKRRQIFQLWRSPALFMLRSWSDAACSEFHSSARLKSPQCVNKRGWRHGDRCQGQFPFAAFPTSCLLYLLSTRPRLPLQTDPGS